MVSRLLLALALAQAVCSGTDEAKLSLSLEPNTAGAARTPSIVGLNAGHRAVTDPTWPAFAQHMGGNGMRVFAMTGFGNLKAKSGLSVLAVLNSYLGSSPEQLAPDGQPYNQACILGLPTFTNYWGHTTTCSDGGGPYWGRDQRGVPVSNVDDWQAAVALIRSWAGHDPAQASSFAYPPPWWMLDFNQNDPSKADPTTGSTAATIAGLEAALGIRPLAVLHQGCGTYAFSSIDPSSSVYWGEHWEVYKVAYVDARWLWSKGVVAQELANEPDLAKYNACVNPNNTDVIARAAQLGVNSTQYVDMYWIDYISLRTRATQDAYEDANADVAAGLIPCPACRGCACPLKPMIYAYGWSRNVLMQKSGNLQGAVLTNQHWRFPASTSPNWSPTRTTPNFPWGSDPGYDAFNIWSYHSYQRTPPSLRDQVNLIVADSANPGGDTQYTPGGVLTPMPVAITELGPELAVTYGQQGDSSDTIYQAARAASQLITMAQYGYEVYMYKFSMQEAASSTSEVTYLQKSGMTWADMSDDGTRSVGDVTSTGKAMALTLPYLFGSKPLLSCAFSTGADEGMNPCVVVRDGNVVHIFLVNDCKDASRAAAGAPGEIACADRSFTIPAAALGADPSSCISVTELSIPAGQCVDRSSGSKGVVSRGTFPCLPGEVAVTTATPAAGYFGEVSAYAPLSHLPPDGLRYTLPVFSTARITIPLKQQELSSRPASQGCTLYAGSKPGAPPSSLQVGISQTEVHDETAVALLQFDLSSGLAAANLALLELTVQAAPYERVVLNMIGVDPSAPPAWDASTLTWDAAGWLLTHAPAGLVRGINDNFVRLGPADGSGGNQLVGHLSLAPSDAPGALKQLDITRFIADAMRARACSVTLAVVRRVRRNLASPASPFGDVIPADDLAGGLATFYGREAAPEQAPQLRVSSDKDAPAYTCQPRVEEKAEEKAEAAVAPQALEEEAAAAPWTKLLLQESVAAGAVCLDGSPAPLYVRPGSGDGASKWILFFQGGAWAQSYPDALSRTQSNLGSSKFNTSAYSLRDILKSDCGVNPAFCDHNLVFAAYCDGTSFSGNADAPVQVDGQLVYFRGWRVLQAILAALMRKEGAGAGLPSLATASSLLISGSSAGALAVYLHADYIADALGAVNPAVSVLALPEVGWFVDGDSIWPVGPVIDVERPVFRHVMSEVLTRIADFANITGGAPEQVNAACVAATPAELRWRCFSAPQHMLPHIRTPVFVVNSMHDQWQAQHILAPDLDTEVSVTSYPPFRPCIKAPLAGCNATQALQWTAYADQFLASLASARAATPPELDAVHGGVITSCPIHDTLMNGLSHSISVGGMTLYDRVAAWVAGEKGEKGEQWTIDGPFGSNPSCPVPGLEAE